MGSILDSTQADPLHDRDVAAPKDLAGVEDALCRLAHHAARDTAGREWDLRVQKEDYEIFTGTPVTASPAAAALGPADLKSDLFPSERSSPSGRRKRTLARLMITACIGAAATLAWQLPGNTAKKMITLWISEHWTSSAPATNPGTEVAAPAAATSAAETAPAQAAAVAPIAPSASSPDARQLEAMARDIAAARRSIEQLTAAQEKMARDIANLQTAEKDIQHRISAPRPAPPRRAPPRPAPQVSSAAPSALPPAQPAPQVSPVPAAPPPAQPAPQVSSTPLESDLPPPPSRPPAPVPER